MQNCRVVLVRPQTAGNVGSIARVMGNLGTSDLVLVSPRADVSDPQARAFATHAVGILDTVSIVETLPEALAECVIVAATSAHVGGIFRKQAVGTPEEILPRFVEVMGSHKVALVFGPEDHGLSDEEIAACHYLIQIPTHEDLPVLNLAQAVTICLYELRCQFLKSDATPVPTGVAPVEAQERAFEQLRDALEQIGFLFGEKADALMYGLRHLIVRAQPTMMELKLLMGLARQIRWHVEQTKGERGP